MITIWPLNGHVIAKELKEADTLTGKPVPAKLLAGVTGHLAEAPTAAPIANTSIALVEYAKQPGLYHGSLDGATLNTALAAYPDNTRLYEVVLFGSELKAASPVRIRKSRVQ